MSSVSSTLSGNGSGFKKMIQDFKKALSERKTPADLVLLNRVIIVFTLLTIGLSVLEHVFKSNLISSTNENNEHLLQSQVRLIQHIQLTSNIRSLVDVANGYE